QQDRFAIRLASVRQRPAPFVAMLARFGNDDEMVGVGRRDEQLLLGCGSRNSGGGGGGEKQAQNGAAHDVPPWKVTDRGNSSGDTQPLVRPADRRHQRRIKVSGILFDAEFTSQWTCLPTGLGAAPSSLLLVRISPSVITVKRPSARDT